MREAVKNYPGLVSEYLGSVVPYTDNYFATLNSAVFSDGTLALARISWMRAGVNPRDRDVAN